MKNNIKYLVSLIVLLTVFICIGNMVMAEDNEVIKNEITEEIEVIKAEDIGIKEVENLIIEESTTTETAVEDKTIDENLPYKEEALIVAEENPNEIPAYDEKNEIAEETEANEKYEGYEEGVYFEPNCFGDCPLHDACYMCEEHDIKAEVFIDEEINPENGWVYLETCIVCGHCLASEPVDDTFVDAYCAK